MSRRRIVADVAGIGLAVVVGYLAFTALELSGTIGRHGATLASRGRAVDSLTLFGTDPTSGASARISVTGSLILIFSEGCAWCSKQLPAWLALANDVRGGIRVLAVSLTPTHPGHPLRNQRGIEYAGVVHATKLRDQLGVTGIPATLLIDTAGIVRFAIGGVLGPRDLRQLRRLLRRGSSLASAGGLERWIDVCRTACRPPPPWAATS